MTRHETSRTSLPRLAVAQASAAVLLLTLATAAPAAEPVPDRRAAHLVLGDRFAGGTNKTRQPEFGSSRRYDGLAAGSHLFELRNLDGPVYVDRICLESASSNEAASSGPGETTTRLETLLTGASSLRTVDLPSGSQAIAAVASSDAPIRLVLLGSVSGPSTPESGARETP